VIARQDKPNNWGKMVLVSTDTFLAKVTELYAEAQSSKGSVAVSCKSGACCLLLCSFVRSCSN
jgi:hypothetical protein